MKIAKHGQEPPSQEEVLEEAVKMCRHVPSHEGPAFRDTAECVELGTEVVDACYDDCAKNDGVKKAERCFVKCAEQHVNGKFEAHINASFLEKKQQLLSSFNGVMKSKAFMKSKNDTIPSKADVLAEMTEECTEEYEGEASLLGKEVRDGSGDGNKTGSEDPCEAAMAHIVGACYDECKPAFAQSEEAVESCFEGCARRVMYERLAQSSLLAFSTKGMKIAKHGQEPPSQEEVLEEAVKMCR